MRPPRRRQTAHRNDAGRRSAAKGAGECTFCSQCSACWAGCCWRCCACCLWRCSPLRAFVLELRYDEFSARLKVLCFTVTLYPRGQKQQGDAPDGKGGSARRAAPKRARRPMPAAAHRPGRRRRANSPWRKNGQNAKAKRRLPSLGSLAQICSAAGALMRAVAAHRACARGKGRVACALRGRRRNGHPLWAHAGVCGLCAGRLAELCRFAAQAGGHHPRFHRRAQISQIFLL